MAGSDGGGFASGLSTMAAASVATSPAGMESARPWWAPHHDMCGMDAPRASRSGVVTGRCREEGVEDSEDPENDDADEHGSVSAADGSATALDAFPPGGCVCPC